MSDNAEELYRQREKRVTDAIALEKPDRVPIVVSFSFFAARYSGVTIQSVMNDPDKLRKASWKVLTEFEPDLAENPFATQLLGPVLETLDCRQLNWPGHGMSSDHGYQYVEGEYMKADEYDHFLSDPSDFVMRIYWPRVCGALSGFGKIRPLRSIYSYTAFNVALAPFGSPEVVAALDALAKAARQSMQVVSYQRAYSAKAKEAGFPISTGASALAPFDTLGDFFRGTNGLMLDMYRRPDKVIAACEKLLPYAIENAVNGAQASGNPRVFIAIHKGLDGFMSLKQFEKFFWPTLRELMLALIDKGLNPCPLWEGNCTSRLETIKDVPSGKACYAFEATDMIKAKEVLGGRVCIRGNLPLSTLITGTPDDVRRQVKKLIDTVGKDGGYIMDSSTALEDAKPKNVKAMFEATREYGAY